MCTYQRYRHHGSYPMTRSFQSVPVNIQEKPDEFQLYLFAPALQKDQIKVSVKDDLLIISYKASTEMEEESGKEQFTRREYRRESFERSFLLSGKVDTEKISVSYTEGVLLVILPKNPEANRPAKDFSVR